MMSTWLAKLCDVQVHGALALLKRNDLSLPTWSAAYPVHCVESGQPAASSLAGFCSTGTLAAERPYRRWLVQLSSWPVA